MLKTTHSLAEQLAAALAPQLVLDKTTERTPRAVDKTLRKLANQLTKAQTKQAAAAQKAMVPSAKKVRKAKAAKLNTALQPYLDGVSEATGAVPRKIAKTVKRLAAEVVKQERKQDKKAAKVARQAAPESVVTPKLKAVAAVSRRLGAAKRPPAHKTAAHTSVILATGAKE